MLRPYVLIDEMGGHTDLMLTATCAWAYAQAGRREEARQIVDNLQTPAAGVNVDPFQISYACVGLEDIACALDELEESYQRRSSNLIFLQTAPGLDPIRHQRRFQAIVDKMDFPAG